MISVLAVDDHPLVLGGVRAAFAAASDVRLIGVVTDSRVALDLVRQHSPDIVLMDVQMPYLDGVSATRQLREAVPACKVLALSGFDFRPIVLEMLEAGAAGYVLKDSVGEDLLAAVRAVMAGEVYVTPRLRPLIPRRLLSPSTFDPPRLTEREAEVLRLVARGTPRKHVADWLGVSPRTVEYHVHQVMVRLEVESIADLIRYATARGWLGDAPAAPAARPR
jgi:DNA-binding NarL/FixJ family response regulator